MTNLILEWPQITMLCFLLLGIVASGVASSRDNDSFRIIFTTFGSLINLWVLYMGGFFS